MDSVRRPLRLFALLPLLYASSSLAMTVTEQTAVLNCQGKAQTEGAKFLKDKATAVGTCLQAIARNMYMINPPATPKPSTAATTCVTQLRKIYDTRGKNLSLPEKLATNIGTKCASSVLPFGDISGSGATVPQAIKTTRIDAWCANFRQFGGTGPLASAADWATCITASHECAADAAIAVEYPRAVEWLLAIRPTIAATTPPTTDTSKISNALHALDDVLAAIGGPTQDTTTPHAQCAPVPPGVMVLPLVQAAQPCTSPDVPAHTSPPPQLPAECSSGGTAPGNTPVSPLTLTGSAVVTLTPIAGPDIWINVAIRGVKEGASNYDGALHVGGTIQFESSSCLISGASVGPCTTIAIPLATFPVACDSSGNCAAAARASASSSYPIVAGIVEIINLAVTDDESPTPNIFLVQGLNLY